jgi:hypothetical protein
MKLGNIDKVITGPAIQRNRMNQTAHAVNYLMRKKKPQPEPRVRGGGRIRKAYAKADAGSGATITCYLDTDSTGVEITVNCEICGGSALNSAIPRLENGDMITVWNDAGTWRSVMTFQATEDCEA